MHVYVYVCMCMCASTDPPCGRRDPRATHHPIRSTAGMTSVRPNLVLRVCGVCVCGVCVCGVCMRVWCVCVCGGGGGSGSGDGGSASEW